MRSRGVIYLIGSLRNPLIPQVGNALRAAGFDAFDDWHGAGPTADDEWQRYEKARGRTYQEAIRGYAARQIFGFDRKHLNRANGVLLALPAGKSGHLEFGYAIGRGKPGVILYPPERELKALAPSWRWLAGVFEGEGSLTNGKINGVGMQLTISMKDEDVIKRLYSIAGRGTLEGPYRRNNPKWSPMFRWAVRRRTDVLYVVRGMWDDLGTRRRAQILRVLKTAGISEKELWESDSPHEFRWDVMTGFAAGFAFSVEEAISLLQEKVRK